MGIPVKLQVFEGPLDLLLHLIDKNKIDRTFVLVYNEIHILNGSGNTNQKRRYCHDTKRRRRSVT